MFESPRNQRGVSIEKVERMVIGMFEHETQTETMVSGILRVQGNLIKHVPQLSPFHIVH